tara:strand:- start:2050 stop:3099 length:1050 start_codon:yes stop_codon:yes gene_type:complete
MHLDQFNYKIPNDLIAIYPIKPRDSSKIVIVEKNFKIKNFYEIVNFLNPNDALVFNNTKVIKARLDGFISQGKISVNLNRQIKNKNVLWTAFIKSNKKPRKKDVIRFSKNFYAIIIDIIQNNNTKEYLLSFECSHKTFKKNLDIFGKVPLPPYINKKRVDAFSDLEDYQSILAKKNGAVAAPTASLHFTKKLLTKIKNKKIQIINITLHINGGTFIPIKTKNINNHKMHFEFGEITENAANKINTTKKNGGRIVAVGTTVLRLLESAKDSKGHIKPFKGETNIFIKPGWKVNTVDGFITNFHTPKSSLLVLVCAIIGKKITKKLYEFAIQNKLRFFSYGDACLIWNKNV